MKNKLILINLISYFILYHLVFELLINISNIVKFSVVFTPLGRLIRKSILHQNIVLGENDYHILFLNLFVSGVFIYIASKYNKENILKLYLRIFFSFIIINLILFCIIELFGKGMSTIPVYICYIVKPLSIMTLLIVPLFWLNQKFIEKIYSKKN